MQQPLILWTLNFATITVDHFSRFAPNVNSIARSSSFIIAFGTASTEASAPAVLSVSLLYIIAHQTTRTTMSTSTRMTTTAHPTAIPMISATVRPTTTGMGGVGVVSSGSTITLWPMKKLGFSCMR